jgi:hypothetical protein
MINQNLNQNINSISPSDFQFISPSEFRVLDRKFCEYSNSSEITFDEFKDILSSISRINKEILNPFFDKLKKKLRETGNNETDILSKLK